MTEKALRMVGGSDALRVGEPLKAVMKLRDLARAIGVSESRASKLQRAGALTFLELTPRLGPMARYSGRKVQQWLDGDGDVSRFFGSARRAHGGRTNG